MPPNIEKPDRAATYQVKVLDKAIDILEAFTLRQKELSVQDMVQATGLNRSTVIRIVANLERRGLLNRASTPRRYRLGNRILEMASIVYSSFSLLEAAAGPLSALEQRSGATIVMVVRHGDYSVVVDRRQGVGYGFAMVSLPGEVGAIRPLTYGPAGLILMAQMPTEAVEDLLRRYPLEQHTPYSPLDPEVFLQRLPEFETKGYVMEVNEVVEGLMGIAAPIYDFAGTIAAVLSLGLPSTRENDTDFVNAAIRDLTRAAAEVSANLGHAPRDGDGNEGGEVGRADEDAADADAADEDAADEDAEGC